MSNVIESVKIFVLSVLFILVIAVGTAYVSLPLEVFEYRTAYSDMLYRTELREEAKVSEDTVSTVQPIGENERKTEAEIAGEKRLQNIRGLFEELAPYIEP